MLGLLSVSRMLLYKQWRLLTLKILLQLLRGFLLYLLWRCEGCLWSVYWGLFNSPEQYMVNLKETVYNCCTSKSIQETNGNYFCQEMKEEVTCTCCQAICQWTLQALSHVSVYMNVHTNEMPLGHHVSSCSRIFTWMKFLSVVAYHRVQAYSHACILQQLSNIGVYTC